MARTPRIHPAYRSYFLGSVVSGSSCRSTLELGSYGRCFASPYSPRHAFGRSLTRPLLASLFGLVHRRLIPFLPHSRLHSPVTPVPRSLGRVVPTASGNEWRRNDTVSEESERKDDRNRRVETEDSFCFLVVSFPFPLRSLSTRHSAPRFVPLLGASLLVMNGKRYEKRSDREEREMS